MIRRRTKKAPAMRAMISHSEPYLMVAPTWILLLVFIAIPLITGMGLSFFSGPIIGEKEFVFLDNYREVIEERYFPVALRNTVIWTVVGVASVFILGFAAAMLLNQKVFGRGVFRGLILIPWVVPPVVVSLVFRWVFREHQGILNFLLYNAKIISEYKSWLGDPSLSLISALIALAWKGYPLVAIFLLAGLQSIPEEQYEAARVDGANTVQAFWHITVPHLKPVILVVLILQTIWVLNMFDITFVLTKGGPGFSSMILSIVVYVAAFQWLNIGHSAAVATIMFIIMVVLYRLYTRIIRE